MKRGYALQENVKGETLRDLGELRRECTERNWDGFGALPLSEQVGTWAERMLCNLPPSIEQPSLSAEPDGMISFEWYRSPDRVISVSISEDGSLNYAALIGAREEHGKISPAQAWPKTLLDLVREVLAA